MELDFALSGACRRITISFVSGLLAVAAFAAPAHALTEVTGDRDTSLPLVIDPAPDSEPLTFETNLAATGGRMMFIQSMPVTKRILSVTLGDLARGSSCTTPTRVMLRVREHATPDLEASQLVIASSPWQALPDQLERVTFTLSSSALLVQGRAYSFDLYWGYSGTDCQYAKVRSWSHNLTAVNAGTKRCTRGPALIREDGSTVDPTRRMWHETGVDDRQPDCVNWGWDASMPGGWLVTTYGYYTSVQTTRTQTIPRRTGATRSAAMTRSSRTEAS